jgi:hypothetical protein
VIFVNRAPEPPTFKVEVRQKGHEWLNDPTDGPRRRKHGKFPSYWAACATDLAKGFQYRCGYSASYTPVYDGNVDHFVGKEKCRANERHELVYEWLNLRWLNARINQKKTDRNEELLVDPFEVEDDWFELDLGRGVLTMTKRVPAKLRQRVVFTLNTLDLWDGPVVSAQREDALEDFRHGTSLERIEHKHPLVARAIRRLMETEDAQLNPADLQVKRELFAAREAAVNQTRTELAGSMIE